MRRSITIEDGERLGLTHIDETGAARMVDVTDKSITAREATARGSVRIARETLDLIESNRIEKGDVLSTARLAGIMAAKRTCELIPLCHALPLTAVDVDLTLDRDASEVDILARVKTEAKTGVEMEALTAVTVAALTIYDMCKALDRSMVIGNIRLTFKAGGRSGVYVGE